METYLYVRALEFGYERSVSRKHGYVEAVTVRITDQYVSRVANVNPIGKVSYTLTAYATQKLTFLVEHNHAMSFEVTHEKFVICKTKRKKKIIRN